MQEPFASQEVLVEKFGGLLTSAVADQTRADQLAALGQIIRIDLRFPSTVLTVNGQVSPPQVISDQAPEAHPPATVTITLDARTADSLWQGNENLSLAVARGLIQAKGEGEHCAQALQLVAGLSDLYQGL